MKSVEVRVTVKLPDGKVYGNYKGDKIILVEGVALAHAVRPENMADFDVLKKDYATKEARESTNAWDFLGDLGQNYAEYAGGLRTSLRNAILAKVEGPGKAIDKSAKDLIALGLFANATDARAFVVGQMKAKGLKVD